MTPSRLLLACVFPGLALSHSYAKSPGGHAVQRHFSRENLYENWPTYDELPLNASYPTKAAWGVWGADDELGALNHITNETIISAAAEIQLGLAVPLNLQLDMPGPPPNPNRKPLQHIFQPGDGYTDDVVVMNTQVSTQFDGLRHFPYSINNSIDTYQWYNDLIADYNEVIGSSPTTVLGVQESAKKGIAVRGVLLDWAGWKDSKNETFDAFTATAISTKELDEVAMWQGMPDEWAKPGDMLVIRTGWNRQYKTLNKTEQTLLPLGNGNCIGMEASDESLRWLWEKKLSLVGADNPAFESVPFNRTILGEARSLHQVFLAGWGQSIVEFLELEDLAAHLHRLDRWSFFLTIQTLNIVSGIASPPNALAIL
ncbi:hypothetical protein S40293_08937 [Stachybotrys chartarum IBT 40293]|nr:hypothetical protein S40293_08937 [Stachybotrys chartarum IBT 40293]